MRKHIAAALAVATLVGGGLAISQTASAHVPQHDVSCEGISVSGRAYGHGATLTLTVNGVTQTQPRGSNGHFAGLSADFTDTGDNTWSFAFDDPDNNFDYSLSGTTEGCSGPTTTTSTTTSTTSTTTTSTTTSTTQPPVDPCSWPAVRTNEAECVDFTVEPACGSITGSATHSISNRPTWTYGVWFNEATPSGPADGTPSLLTFPEDYNDGSVTVNYWVAGTENDAVRGVPTYSSPAQMVIDTDCEEDPVDTTEPPVETTEPPVDTDPEPTDPPATDPPSSTEPPATPPTSAPNGSVPPVTTIPPVVTTPPEAPSPPALSGQLPATR